MDIDLIRELLDPTATADEARRLAVARNGHCQKMNGQARSPVRTAAGGTGQAFRISTSCTDSPENSTVSSTG